MNAIDPRRSSNDDCFPVVMSEPCIKQERQQNQSNGTAAERIQPVAESMGVLEVPETTSAMFGFVDSAGFSLATDWELK